ncbi:MAG: hypothetical protein M3342_05840, partial [Bacteroidota bacterium]|nr:hypothetical protein [Bacteroidota bacterium]
YYNLKEGNFLYTTDGGKSWQRKKASVELANTLDDKVTLNSPLPEAWQNNEEHRRVYNGVHTDYTAGSGSNSSTDQYEEQSYYKREEKVEPKKDKEENRDKEREHKRKEEKGEGFLKKIKEEIKKELKGEN